MTILDDSEEESSHQKKPDEDARSMPPAPVPRSADSIHFGEMSAVRRDRSWAVSPGRTEVTREHVDPVGLGHKRKIEKGKVKAASSPVLKQQTKIVRDKRDDHPELVQVHAGGQATLIS